MSKVEPGQGLGRGRGRAPTFDQELAIELYRERGWSVARIARHFGKADMTIYRAFKKHGVEMMWSKGRTTCRHGHARIFWAYRDGDKWRCRRCARGDIGFLYMVLKHGEPAAHFSTLDLAMSACPSSLEWFVVTKDELWSATPYTIEAFTLDPDRSRKL